MKDDKAYVENYRPLSLLSLISKVLERCVLYNDNHLTEAVDNSTITTFADDTKIFRTVLAAYLTHHREL
jgi:hypothetical protein